jgi:hypothetical protein
MGTLLWRHLKEHVYAVRPRTIEDLMARIQASVTMVDTKMFRRVRKNTLRRTAVCFKMDEGRFEHLL